MKICYTACLVASRGGPVLCLGKNGMSDEFTNAVAALAEYGIAHGLEALVAKFKSIDTLDLGARRRAAMFLVGVRDHDIGPVDLMEYPFGVVGICGRCEAAVKIRRDAAGIEGSAVDYDCPSGRWARQ